MYRKDPLTGEEFIPHKINQKFASKENQVIYNNALAKQRRDFRSRFINPIENNFRILFHLLGKKERMTIDKDELLQKGYRFGALTHNVYWQGRVYAMCFTRGVFIDDDNLVSIIKCD